MRTVAFCGVRFMAEVAKILSPQKTVILPDMAAGCSLEDSCPPEQFAAFRAAHPDHIALTYINCSAAVKAHSTSSSRHRRRRRSSRSCPRIRRSSSPRTESRRLFQPEDGPRHAALAGRVHRARGLLRDGALEAEGAALRRARGSASRMPGLHPRSRRSGGLDARHPGVALASDADTIIVATEPHIIHPRYDDPLGLQGSLSSLSVTGRWLIARVVFKRSLCPG